MVRLTYEDHLEDMIAAHQDRCADALRSIILDLDAGNFEGNQLLEEPAHIRSLISYYKGEARITPARLKKHVGSFLIPNLKSNHQIRDRVTLIYKSISGYGTHSPITDKEFKDAVDSILTKGEYPPIPGSSRREGVENQYKAAGNIFATQTKSSLETLKFVIAILGIKEGALKSYLNGDEIVKPEIKGLNEDKILLKSKAIYFTVGAVILVFIAVISGLLSKDKPRQKLRERILASRVFNQSVSIDDTNPKDSISIEVVRVESYDKLIRIDTFPLNSMWVRIKVSNFSDSLSFIPDGLFYKPLIQEKFDGVLLAGVENVSSQENVQLTLPHDPGRAYEWKIVNDPLISIPPKSAAFSLIKLMAHKDAEDQIASFRLGVSGSLGYKPIDAESILLKLSIKE